MDAATVTASEVHKLSEIMSRELFKGELKIQEREKWLIMNIYTHCMKVTIRVMLDDKILALALQQCTQICK